LLVRVALAEQTYGAVGLLTARGLTNEQLHTLFAVVLAATASGALLAAATMSLQRLPYQIMVAALIIAAGAWLDSGTGVATGPEQLYLSQAMVGLGTALFMGPALVYGFSRMAEQGPDFLVSFVVLFGLTQNIGSLAGSALLGSYQVIALRMHTQALAARMTGADPLIGARLQDGGAALGQALAREANALAFDDVFALVAWLAFGTAVYVALLIVRRWFTQRSASFVVAA
jgi:hypothetical protein